MAKLAAPAAPRWLPDLLAPFARRALANSFAFFDLPTGPGMAMPPVHSQQSIVNLLRACCANDDKTLAAINWNQ